MNTNSLSSKTLEDALATCAHYGDLLDKQLQSKEYRELREHAGRMSKMELSGEP